VTLQTKEYIRVQIHKLFKQNLKLQNQYTKIMKKYLTIISMVTFTLCASAQEILPSNPEPGKCYVKCVTHDEFKTETVKVKTSPEYKTLSIIPAKYKWVEDKVLVKQASKKFIYHPAEYKWETVPYVKKEKEGLLQVQPAQLENSSELVEVFPKTANWEYTTYSECTSPNPEDCQTLCYVEKPSQNVTVLTKVLKSDATTTASNKPENNSSYKKQVIAKEAWVEEIEIPAVYSTIKRQVVDVPAKTVENIVAAKFKDVNKKVLVKQGGISSWEEIDCGLVRPNELDILWNLGSAKLREDAKKKIDEVLHALLVEKPNVSVELSSHTDSRGSDQFNNALSQKRADAVKNYLISKGIASSRLISKGYGETRLKNNCSNGVSCSELKHQMNRRTEYKVIGN